MDRHRCVAMSASPSTAGRHQAPTPIKGNLDMVSASPSSQHPAILMYIHLVRHVQKVPRLGGSECYRTGCNNVQLEARDLECCSDTCLLLLFYILKVAKPPTGNLVAPSILQETLLIEDGNQPTQYATEQKTCDNAPKELCRGHIEYRTDPASIEDWRPANVVVSYDAP